MFLLENINYVFMGCFIFNIPMPLWISKVHTKGEEKNFCSASWVKSFKMWGFGWLKKCFSVNECQLEINHSSVKIILSLLFWKWMKEMTFSPWSGSEECKNQGNYLRMSTFWGFLLEESLKFFCRLLDF